MKIRLKKKIWDILRCRKVAIYQNSSGNCTRRYRFDVAPLSGLQKRKLTRGRGGRKGREKARSCFITKAADIKFHRQTWNSRVRGTSVFRLLFATGGPCRRRKPCASIGQIRAKNKARLQKERYGEEEASIVERA